MQIDTQDSTLNNAQVDDFGFEKVHNNPLIYYIASPHLEELLSVGLGMPKGTRL